MQPWQLVILLPLALVVAAAQQQQQRAGSHGQGPRNGLIAYSSNTTGSFQIWALNPDGSSPRPLTSLNQGTELAAHPAWSPDGTRLAFSGMQGSNLNIWIREADGSLRQLTHSVAPTISIVPAWMPDGKRIVFESNRAVPPADSTPEDPYDLYSVNVATGGDVKRLTAAAGGRTGGMGGKPSPCGKYLAFASDRDLSSPLGLFDLYVVKLDAKGVPLSKGGKFVAPERLTKGAANQFSRSWSPDSKYIVFNSQVGWTGASADKVGAGRIMTVEANGGKPWPLTQPNDRYPAFVSGGAFPALRGDITPAWSPDGSRIAFASQRAPNGDFEIVTVRAFDGKDKRRLTNVLSEQHVTVAWQPVFV